MAKVREKKITMDVVLTARMQEVVHWRMQILMLTQVLRAADRVNYGNNHIRSSVEPLRMFLYERLTQAQYDLLRIALVSKRDSPETQYAFEQATRQMIQERYEIMGLLDPRGAVPSVVRAEERDALRSLLKEAAGEFLYDKELDDLLDGGV